ncbi:MAG: hypothetical protein EHM13_15560 [Acidobacteria bacterium]|nr:MAG: hypothetical protein EHM13_15560 [Acidobacteriota bacterium]
MDQKTQRLEKSARPIEILRTRHGGMSKELKDYFNERTRIKKAIRTALGNGPLTVPQIAEACQLPPPRTVWHVMAMRRYGEIVEVGESGDYPLYGLKAKGA